MNETSSYAVSCSGLSLLSTDGQLLLNKYYYQFLILSKTVFCTSSTNVFSFTGSRVRWVMLQCVRRGHCDVLVHCRDWNNYFDMFYFVYININMKFSYKYIVDKQFLIWLTYFMIHICYIPELQICMNIMSQTVITYCNIRFVNGVCNILC